MPAEYPIADYALIGNCETAALVNSDGGIDWLCLPAFDAPSFFGAVLDRQNGGNFSIRPAGEYRVERRYLGDTAILETRFICKGGTVLLTDFFVIARERKARFYDFTSLHPTRKLVRLVELEEGDNVDVQLRIAARPDYARRSSGWVERNGGFHCTEAAVFGNVPLRNAVDVSATFAVRRGRRFHVVLDYSDVRATPGDADIDRWLTVTKAFWNEWNLFNYYRGRHADVVRRSAVTLKLLTHAPSGAFVAAPTTSLPEKIGGDRNWDYRFSWLRDTSLFINALFRIGYSGEAKAYLEYLADHCGDDDRRDLPVLLAVRKETDIAEQMLPHLAGYQGSQPVRRGNRAHGQLQLDNCGHMLQSLVFWKHTGGKLDQRKRNLAAAALDTIRRRWHEPDNGIWEVAERRQFTYGKVASWLAVMRAHDLGLIETQEADRLAGEIRSHTLDRGIRNAYDAQFFAETCDDDTIDCASLLAFNTGFLPGGVAQSSRERIESRLGVNGWLYRSEHDKNSGEGAFILCSFWLIEHLLREGKIARAERTLDTIIAQASPLGLFSEQFEPSTGAFLGNFPQAFSHLGLITAILNIEQSKADACFARLPEHQKFQKSAGRTIGVIGVLAGFWRVPRTVRLVFASRSRWPAALELRRTLAGRAKRSGRRVPDY